MPISYNYNYIYNAERECMYSHQPSQALCILMGMGKVAKSVSSSLFGSGILYIADMPYLICSLI